jgi:hypothetical protein
MPVAAAFLPSCRARILTTPEHAAFAAAYAAFASASRADRLRYWRAAYDDARDGLSPAYRLRREIRGTVAALADAAVTRAERESAYETLSAEYVPAVRAPLGAARQAAALRTLLDEDMAS